MTVLAITLWVWLIYKCNEREIRTIWCDKLIGAVLKTSTATAEDKLPPTQQHKDDHCSAFMWRNVPTSSFKVMAQQPVSDQDHRWMVKQRVKLGHAPKPPCALKQKLFCYERNGSGWEAVALAWLMPRYKLHLSAAYRALFLLGWHADLRKIKLNLFHSPLITWRRYLQWMNWWPHLLLKQMTRIYSICEVCRSVHFYFP